MPPMGGVVFRLDKEFPMQDGFFRQGLNAQ